MKYGIVITTKTLATKDGSVTDVISGSRGEMLDLAKQWAHQDSCVVGSPDTTYKVFRLNADGTLKNPKDVEGHDWKVVDINHPEMTGWKCKTCGTVYATYTNDPPSIWETCAPDSDPVA